MQKITFKTNQEKEIIDITRIINDLLVKNSYDKGMLFLFCTHTSCAITTTNLKEGMTADLADAYREIVPKLNYKNPNSPSLSGNFVMSSLIGASLTIPVESANTVIGSSQRIVLVEFAGPRERHITLSFLSEK